MSSPGNCDHDRLWSWGITEKLVRPEALVAKGKTYVEASKASGARDLYVIMRDSLLACVPAKLTGLVYTVVVAQAIQTAIEYIGVCRNVMSVEEVRMTPFVTWGTILPFGLVCVVLDPPSTRRLTLTPTLCIAILVLSLVLIGERISAVISKDKSRRVSWTAVSDLLTITVFFNSILYI